MLVRSLEIHRRVFLCELEWVRQVSSESLMKENKLGQLVSK